MSTFNFPIFGSDGQQEGTLTQTVTGSPRPTHVGQMDPLPLPVFHDSAAEAVRIEERYRMYGEMHCPDLLRAQDAVHEVRAARNDAHARWKACSNQVLECRSAMQRTAPGQPGLVGDRRSTLAIAEGYLTVAEHNLNLADEKLRKALEKLAAVTGAKL